jgi:hypothetical protein
VNERVNDLDGVLELRSDPEVGFLPERESDHIDLDLPGAVRCGSTPSAVLVPTVPPTRSRYCANLAPASRRCMSTTY